MLSDSSAMEIAQDELKHPEIVDLGICDIRQPSDLFQWRDQRSDLVLIQLDDQVVEGHIDILENAKGLLKEGGYVLLLQGIAQSSDSVLKLRVVSIVDNFGDFCYFSS
jgi:hypothetical protein